MSSKITNLPGSNTFSTVESSVLAKSTSVFWLLEMCVLASPGMNSQPVAPRGYGAHL